MTATIEATVTVDANGTNMKASQLLASHTGLSQQKVKDAMQKGAVWLHRGKGMRRFRRASKTLIVGDKLELNYNPEQPIDPRIQREVLETKSAREQQQLHAKERS